MSHTASIFNFGRVVHDHDWNFIVPGSVFWRMYRVISGEAEVFIYGNGHRIKSGYLYMIPAFVAHEDRLSGVFEHEYIHFRLDDPLVSSLFDGRRIAFEIPLTPCADIAFTRIGELCRGFELETPVPQKYEKKSSYMYWSQRYESLSIESRIEIGGCIRILLSDFMRHSVPSDSCDNPRVVRGKVYMDNNFSNPIIIEDVAREAGMKPESFTRAFRKFFGRTPLSYLNERRINSAKNLLLLSSLSVKEISAKCGFGDVSYFCQAFRKNTSMTPGQFRKGSFPS